MKTYRISHRPRTGPPPPGFETLESHDSSMPIAELLVPIDVAQRLVQGSEAAKAAAAAAEEPRSIFPPPPPPPPPRIDRGSEFQVTLPREEVQRRRPRADTVAVWEWPMLRALVERHNAGHGSADTTDRRRMTTILKDMVSAGPWKSVVNPAGPAPDALMRELRDELGHLPGLVSAIEASIERAAASDQPFRLGPLLLVGLPGTGKSYAALRVAELLQMPSRLIDMAAQQTNSFLHGSDRHWGNAAPGALFELLIHGPCANPLIVLDELDKASKRSTYDPLTPLHGALEASTSKATKDLCTQVIFDASHVSYIATANALSSIPLSLLSRFEIIHCAEPGPREALRLARRVWDQAAEKAGVEGRPSREVLVCLAEVPPRRMVQLVERAIGRMRAAGRRQVELRDFEASQEAHVLH